LFTDPSTIKYVVTVLAAASIVLLATVRAPLRLLVGIAILVAPLDFVSTFAGLQVTPLLAVDALAVLVWLSRSRVGGFSALRAMTPAFVLLLMPAIAGSAQPGRWVLWLAVTVLTGCLTFVIAREPGGPAFIAAMLM